MNLTNNCTKKGLPLIKVFARQGKSDSRIREEESVISRMDKIHKQIDKWRKQKNARIDEEFLDQWYMAISHIESLFWLFPGEDNVFYDYDNRKFFS